MKVDDELDLHGHTAATARTELDLRWGSRRWEGLRRVRIIHGQGATLWAIVRSWCDERGIPWAPEPHNPGATILHPALRSAAVQRWQNRPLGREPRLTHRRSSPPAPRPRAARPRVAPPAEDTGLFEAEMERLAREERARRKPPKR